MNTYLLISFVLLGLLNLALLLVQLRRRPASLGPDVLRPYFDAVVAETRRVEQSTREEFTRQRDEANRSSAALREEVNKQIATGLENLLVRQAETQRAIEERLDAFRSTLDTTLRTFGENNDTRFSRLRQELNESGAQARNETRTAFEITEDGMITYKL